MISPWIWCTVLGLSLADQSSWTDVCHYHDVSGTRCCPPDMESSRYLVVSEELDWLEHSILCDNYGGWLTVFESQEEWACVDHWVSEAFHQGHPSAQRYAISLRSDWSGIYQWQNSDGSSSFPEFYKWAPGHPRDSPCVSMEAGSGQWIDGACTLDRSIHAICEKHIDGNPSTPTITSTTHTTPTSHTPTSHIPTSHTSTSDTPTSHTPTETTENEPGEWTVVCEYQDQEGDTCLPRGWRAVSTSCCLSQSPGRLTVSSAMRRGGTLWCWRHQESGPVYRLGYLQSSALQLGATASV